MTIEFLVSIDIDDRFEHGDAVDEAYSTLVNSGYDARTLDLMDVYINGDLEYQKEDSLCSTGM